MAVLLPAVRAVPGTPDSPATLLRTSSQRAWGAASRTASPGFLSPPAAPSSALLPGAPASVGDLGLPEEVQDQGGWSERRWDQLKNAELLLGSEDLHGDESHDPHVALG